MLLKVISATKSVLVLVAFATSVVCFSAVSAQDAADEEATASMPGHKANEEGSRHYKNKDYDAALPYLHVAAEWGFKDAQVRLGQIYLKGLGATEKNKLRGLAWIGTAASKPSQPSYEKMYERELDKVSDENKASVERAVDAYTQRFGSGAAGVTCKMARPLGSNMAQLSCDYDANYEFSRPASPVWADHEANSF